MEKYLESTLEAFADDIKPEHLASRFRQMIMVIAPLYASVDGDPLYTHKQFPVFDVLWKCILLLVLAFLMYMVATR